MLIPLTVDFDRGDDDCSSCLLRFESAEISDNLALVYLEYGGIKPCTKCSCTRGSNHAINITIKSTFDIGKKDVGHKEDLRLSFIIRPASAPPKRRLSSFLIFIGILDSFLLMRFRNSFDIFILV